MLKFIGNGSAFNTKLGNNSAFIKEGDALFLIDCGSNTFDRILEANLLDGVKKVDIAITHFHDDHIGSLGGLIFYCYFILKIKAEVYSPENTLTTILTAIGVDKDFYNFNIVKGSTRLKAFALYIKPIEVEHDGRIKCYAYEAYYKAFNVYYSGDSKKIPIAVLDNFFGFKYDIFYQDTSMAHYEGNVHMSLQDLTLTIPEVFRHKVYCMHLDKTFDHRVAKLAGFNVTNNIFDK